MEENRKNKRSKVDFKSEVHSDEGMTFSNAKDLSNGGLFISTPEPLKEGSEIDLSLQMPGQEPVEIKGVVKWVSINDDEGKRSGMGVEFKDLSDKDMESLKKVTNS